MGLEREIDPAATVRVGGRDAQDLLEDFEPGGFKTLTAELDLCGGGLVLRRSEQAIGVMTTEAAWRIGRSVSHSCRRVMKSNDVCWYDVSTVALPTSGPDLDGVPGPWRDTGLVLVPVLTGCAFWKVDP